MNVSEQIRFFLKHKHGLTPAHFKEKARSIHKTKKLAIAIQELKYKSIIYNADSISRALEIDENYIVYLIHHQNHRRLKQRA